MAETTPIRISNKIKEFARDIDPSQEPIYLPVKPTPRSRPGMCFASVRDHASEHGGDIQHGWMIWEEPGKHLNAEFHAVWISPNDGLIDITKTVDGEETILFLPDTKRVYKNSPVENRRMLLLNNDITRAWDRREHQRQLLNRKYFRHGRIDEIAVARELAAWDVEESESRARSKPGRNQPCVCGSGKKFKKCCGK